MNRIEIIAAIVKVVSSKSELIAQPDPFAETISTLFGGEPYEKRVARAIDADITRATEAVKRASLNHQFKKITKHY